MDIDQASNFLAGTILFGIGCILITVIVLVINNIIHKYWKTFGWKFFPAYVQKENIDYKDPPLDKNK